MIKNQRKMIIFFQSIYKPGCHCYYVGEIKSERKILLKIYPLRIFFLLKKLPFYSKLDVIVSTLRNLIKYLIPKSSLPGFQVPTGLLIIFFQRLHMGYSQMLTMFIQLIFLWLNFLTLLIEFYHFKYWIFNVNFTTFS